MPEDKNKEVSLRLKEIRRQLQLSQEAFARPLGCTGASVSEMEKGKYKPNFDLIVGMVEHYDVNIFYLLFGLGEVFKDGSPPPPIPRPVQEVGEEPGLFFPESALKVNKEEFTRFLGYLEGSSIMQYRVLAFFQELLHSHGQALDNQVKNYRKRKK